MALAALRATAFTWPDRTVAVDALPALTADERAACAGLGIEEIRADDTVSATDLAASACRAALAEAAVDPGDVGALVLVEPRAPDALLASDVTRLQALLGLAEATAFTVGGLGCVSSTPALLTARGLLAADPRLNHVLIAHGSKPAAPRRYRHPVTVNGDGGMAVVVSRSGPVRLLDLVQHSNGDYWDLFSLDYRTRPASRWVERCRDVREYTFRLAVESRNRLRALYAELLERNGLQPSDIDCHIAHNLSEGSLRFIAEALDTEVAPSCADNLRRYGHLGPADVLLNLHTELRAGGKRPGWRAVLVNASPAAAWSAALVALA